MKIIITTDSDVLNERIQKMLSGIKDLEIAAKGFDLKETAAMLEFLNPSALIISFNRINGQVFDELKLIKKTKPNLIVVVLSSFPFQQYKTHWKEAGANYVFDQAMQFSKMVDVLCDELYKEKLDSILSNDALSKKDEKSINKKKIHL